MVERYCCNVICGAPTASEVKAFGLPPLVTVPREIVTELGVGTAVSRVT